MTAREYFESARAAQRLIDARAASLAAMKTREGLRAQSYEAVGRSTGRADPMRATDARIDAEAACLREMERLRAEVADARAVCAGYSAANPRSMGGAALELHYVDGMTWREVAVALGVSWETARRAAYVALDWVDAVGVAAARAGAGRAEA